MIRLQTYLCRKLNYMSEINQYPVLDYLVNVLKNAIADSKVEKQSQSVSVVKDGNDIIHVEQLFDESGNNAKIVITDKKLIVISEDLLEPLQTIHTSVKGNESLKKELEAATIIINGLDIETELVFQAARDCFDELSDSYEFSKNVEKEVSKLKAPLKFGANPFELVIVNDAASIQVTPNFIKSLDAGVTKAIEADVAKVQNALNKHFKKG